jgi:hypothetical protein
LPFYDHQQTITEAPICDFAPADELRRKRRLPFAGSPADRVSGALRAATTRPWAFAGKALLQTLRQVRAVLKGIGDKDLGIVRPAHGWE